MLLRELKETDRSELENLIRATSYFREDDIQVALELIEDRLGKGDASDYLFIVAVDEGKVAGFACYGLIPLTESSYDLYWIVVEPDRRRRNIGACLMKHIENDVIRRGGKKIYADTSDAAAYKHARLFYTGMGFVTAARLPGFYRTHEAKLIYCRELGPG